jgi:hypothetical protein
MQLFVTLSLGEVKGGPEFPPGSFFINRRRIETLEVGGARGVRATFPGDYSQCPFRGRGGAAGGLPSSLRKPMSLRRESPSPPVPQRKVRRENKNRKMLDDWAIDFLKSIKISGMFTDLLDKVRLIMMAS